MAEVESWSMCPMQAVTTKLQAPWGWIWLDIAAFSYCQAHHHNSSNNSWPTMSTICLPGRLHSEACPQLLGAPHRLGHLSTVPFPLNMQR